MIDSISADKIKLNSEKIMGYKLLRYLISQSGSISDLAEIFDVSIANLSRYHAKKVLPNLDLIELMLDYSVKHNILHELIKQNIEIDMISNLKIIDNSRLQSNTIILDLISYLISKTMLKSEKIDAIVTTETDGIPFCMSLAHVLDLPSIFATKSKPVKTPVYSIEIPKASARINNLHIPVHITEYGENFLVVDDVIRTGTTQQSLISLLTDVVGVNVLSGLILIGIGSQWQSLDMNGIPIDIVLSV
ncbi:MAG: phosphoribosyltransferase family protein [Candidatus Heimdallarchaeota archaeon]|nr:phosphoribosyltransferase family protein [Candidatus Heimdallarchaeota archaeon]